MSDAGSQYLCRWVGRGTHPTHIHTQKVSKMLVFPLFDLIIMDGLTDGQTKPLIELRVRHQKLNLLTFSSTFWKASIQISFHWAIRKYGLYAIML